MKAKSQLRFTMVLAAGLVVAGIVLLTDRSAQSYQGAADTKSIKWEYTSSAVESNSMQTKLDDLGNNGWEVIAVTRADAALDQGNDGKTHIRTTEFQVTARRVKK